MNIITKQFKKYKLPISNEKMEEFCLPKKYKLLPQQEFLSELLISKYSPWNIDKNIRGILIYHNIGSAKTCTAIRIAENFKNKLNIIIVLPAALMNNLYFELRSECTENEYVTKTERELLKKMDINSEKYKKIINNINNKINKYYTIYSYHKFIELVHNKKLKNINNSLLIIDEIQNMISINGTFYNTLNSLINKSKKFRLILLSATPIFDRPIEIALTLNLLKRDLFNIEKFNQEYLDEKYNLINIENFKNKIKNLISYYRGAPPQAYPQVNFKTIKCIMNSFQYKSYLTSLSSETNFLKGSFKNVDILKMPSNFFLGPRIISNIAYPNKCIGELGYKSFNKNNLLLKNIKKYSCKFHKILKAINKSTGLNFIFSNFKEYGGIKAFVKFLEYHKWKNFITHGEGKKRFAIWSGDENNNDKENIKNTFNNKLNINGSKIKILFGSPSIKEGVSLLRVENVHILEPYWNISRILQIMGRAIRFCSHKDVPKDKRVVNVYLYLSTYKGIKSIDQYIWSLAKKKQILIQSFENILKETAFDCELFYNRNVYKSDEYKLKCINY